MYTFGLDNTWTFMYAVCGGVVRAYGDYTTPQYLERDALIFPRYSTASFQAILGEVEEADYYIVLKDTKYAKTRAARFISLPQDFHNTRYYVKGWREISGTYSLLTLVNTDSKGVV